MYPDFVRLWIFNKKNWEFFLRENCEFTRIIIWKFKDIFFLLSPTFFLINVPVQRLYWSDVCTSLTVVLSDVCKSYVCIVRRLYWYRSKDNSANTFANFFYIIIYFRTSCLTILYYSAFRRYQTFVILLTKCTAGSMSIMLICTAGSISKISCSLHCGVRVQCLK